MRRRKQTRFYAISYLLSRQPKGLQKQRHYREMVDHYTSSEALRRLRISRRCYTLLNAARIEPHNLRHFYRTYRLPADPFFPLFFAVKRAYLVERERVKQERRAYILSRMRSLPPFRLAAVKYLGHLERSINAAGDSPVWQKELFPGSKKKADSYLRYSELEWFETYRCHLDRLRARYRRMTDLAARRIHAYLVLEIIPDRMPSRHVHRSEVTGAYRRLSLRYHPDRGGDAEVFVQLKRARDVLME